MTDAAGVHAALAQRFPTLDAAMAPSLERITALMDMLGEPQRAYPAIHIGGTNGKTSTARMVDSLLTTFGLATGRFTSPHLEAVNERISFAGQPISDDRLAWAYDDVAPFVAILDGGSEQPVTYFELLTAMAFAAFADAPVDVAVVEVGMGGTWDATNVLQAGVAVVTPVALDHPQLGSTLAEVASEKAGIVHEGASLVLGRQELEAAEVLLRRAVEVSATVAREGLEFGVLESKVAVGGQVLSLQGIGGVYDDVFVPLHGAHQASNAACALAAVEAFFGADQRRIDVDVVREGFAGVTSPGRLEVVRRSPTILLDGAHNPAGAEATAQALVSDFAFERLVGVVGILADKDAEGILVALEPALDAVVVTRSQSSRSMPIEALAELARSIFGDDRVEVEPRLDEAIETAVRRVEEAGVLAGGGVVVTGSLTTVGEARHLLRTDR